MLEDVILLCIVMVPAIAAWAVPQLRKMNGNFIISLKTIPLGVLTLCLTSHLAVQIYRWLCEYHCKEIEGAGIYVKGIPVAAALLVIALSGWLIHKKFRVEKRYNPLPALLLFFPALLAVCILAFMIDIFAFAAFKTKQSEWRPCYLPPQNEVKMVFEQQSIHPFLAEYNYRLRFVKEGRKIYQQLFTNCGGKTHFNIYCLKDGRFLFRDKDWDYIVDVAGQQAYRLEPFGGKLYMAPVPNEEVHSWGGPYEKNGQIMMEMGSFHGPAEEVTGILDGMVYYGCIRDKFYPASAAPEEKIKALF